MKKILFVILTVSLLFLAACTQQQVACTKDAKICPDGSAVGRVPPDCEFAPCPARSDKPVECEASDCEPQLGMPNYICPDGKTTAGPTGRCLGNSDGKCGWEVISCPTENQNESMKQNYCTPQQREADFCTEIYQPVCGWFDTARTQCIRYPCAQTFSNSCFACMDKKVLYWTEDECPK